MTLKNLPNAMALGMQVEKVRNCLFSTIFQVFFADLREVKIPYVRKMQRKKKLRIDYA